MRLVVKVTGKDELDGTPTYDFWCYMCGFRNTNTEYMKQFIEFQEKEGAKQQKFPEEYFGTSVHKMKENRPEILTELKKLASMEGGLETINRWRQSKTYKAYPKSLSDEDKLFLTILSWNIRFGALVKFMPPNVAMKKINELMEPEGITY